MTPRFAGYSLAIVFSLAVHYVWISTAVGLIQNGAAVEDMMASEPVVTPVG